MICRQFVVRNVHVLTVNSIDEIDGFYFCRENS